MNENIASGFHKNLNDNDSMLGNWEKEVSSILASEMKRKGYGMKGDEATDENG